MNKIICVLILLAFTGCTVIAKGVKVGIQTDSEFNELILEDVQQAKVLAAIGDDPLATKCWTYLEEFIIVNAPDEAVLTSKTLGALSIYQKAGNGRRNVVEVKISDQFRLECAPMLMDSMGVLGRLGIKLAL